MRTKTYIHRGLYKKKVQNAKRGRGNPAPTVAVARFLNMSRHRYVHGRLPLLVKGLTGGSEIDVYPKPGEIDISDTLC